jgi:PilZ domain
VQSQHDPNIVLEKLTRGVLHISGATGLRYVCPSVRERLRLLWLFRNFRILQQRVLPERQQKWIASLCDSRLTGYRSSLDREIACVIGTIIVSEASSRPPHDERRLAPRLPIPFQVRYGVGAELVHGQGCDLSETGLAFDGPRVFIPGSEITVHYRLGANTYEGWARTRAVVRNCSGNHMGVEFCIIHPRDRAQLRELTKENPNAVSIAAKAT